MSFTWTMRVSEPTFPAASVTVRFTQYLPGTENTYLATSPSSVTSVPCSSKVHRKKPVLWKVGSLSEEPVASSVTTLSSFTTLSGPARATGGATSTRSSTRCTLESIV